MEHVPRQSRISTDLDASSVPLGSQANERERHAGVNLDCPSAGDEAGASPTSRSRWAENLG
jgi:hypothetical protein